VKLRHVMRIECIGGVLQPAPGQLQLLIDCCSLSRPGAQRNSAGKSVPSQDLPVSCQRLLAMSPVCSRPPLQRHLQCCIVLWPHTCLHPSWPPPNLACQLDLCSTVFCRVFQRRLPRFTLIHTHTLANNHQHPCGRSAMGGGSRPWAVTLRDTSTKRARRRDR